MFDGRPSAALRCLSLLLAVISLTACEEKALSAGEGGGSPSHLVYVASNGWHTAIIVSSAALSATDALPESADFPGASFLEFGWGDRAFYQAKEPTLGETLTAALTPTPAVIHIAGLQSRRRTATPDLR